MRNVAANKTSFVCSPAQVYEGEIVTCLATTRDFLGRSVRGSAAAADFSVNITVAGSVDTLKNLQTMTTADSSVFSTSYQSNLTGNATLQLSYGGHTQLSEIETFPLRGIIAMESSASPQSDFVRARYTSNDVPSVTLVERVTTISPDLRDSFTFQVQLQKPSGVNSDNIEVYLSSSSPDVVVSPARLTFSAFNSTIPQNVTISAVDDDYYHGTRLVNVTLSASASPFPDVNMSVTLFDDECDMNGCGPGGFCDLSTTPHRCAQCAAGQHNNVTNPERIDASGPGAIVTECSSCIAGMFAASTGMRACVNCNPEEFQHAPGQAACLACGAGKHRNNSEPAASPEATACATCPVGEYQPNAGQLMCVKCAQGQYRNTSAPATSAGTSACLACKVGQFQNTSGAITCLQCPVGTFRDAVADAKACEPCAGGQYQNQMGQLACSPWRTCAEGFGKSVDGSSYTDLVCEGCVQGHTFSSSDSREACKHVGQCNATTEWESSSPLTTADRACATHAPSWHALLTSL